MNPNIIRIAITALLAAAIFNPINAQDVRTIKGNIATSETEAAMYEELQPAVTIADKKIRNRQLVRKGSRFIGHLVMNPNSIGHEIGSIVQVKKNFIVKDIRFSIIRNDMEGSRAEIRFYKMKDDKTEKTTLVLPIQQDIPVSRNKADYIIYPEENILLTPGKYFICFVLTDCSKELKEKWADADNWTEEEWLEVHMNDNDCMDFPIYIKKSHERWSGTDGALEDFWANIGLTVHGIEYR